jgi:hypothetical protein
VGLFRQASVLADSNREKQTFVVLDPGEKKSDPYIFPKIRSRGFPEIRSRALEIQEINNHRKENTPRKPNQSVQER